MSNRFRIALTTVGIGLLASFIVAAPADAGERNDDLNKIVKRYSLQGTLESVIPPLEKTGGVKIAVDWPALKTACVEKTEKVQLSGSDEKFVDILELLLAQVEKKGKPLAWRRDKKTGLIHITTQADIIARRFGARRFDTSQQTALPRENEKQRSISSAREADIRFDNTPLEDVLITLRKGAKVNMFVNWEALKTVGVTRDTPITIRARDISTARALDLVMLECNGDKDRMRSVYWVVDKGIVRVDTGEVLDTIMRTKVEDVADLLQITPNFQGPRMKLATIGETNPTDHNGQSNSSSTSNQLWDDEAANEDDDEAEAEETSAELRANQKHQLIESIKNSIGPEMWYPNGKGTITIFRNQLVITQSLLGWKLMEQGNR